jgi:hypothetical protein
MGRQRPTPIDRGNKSHQALGVPDTAFGHYDHIHGKSRSRQCTMDKTYGGVLCSKGLAMVLHPP